MMHVSDAGDGQTAGDGNVAGDGAGAGAGAGGGPWSAALWRAVVAVLIAVPIAALLLQAATWTRLGIDVPFLDDWRLYILGRDGSFEIPWLFQAAGGTVSPVGRALESLASVVFAGNVVVYELVSMVLFLGVLLFLQWRLMRAAMGDLVFTACCFFLVLPMLRAGTYWGGATAAYDQGLPLIAILACLWIIVRPSTSRRTTVIATSLLGLLAGFSYISGAFAAIAAGLVLLALGRWIEGSGRDRLIDGGLALLAVGSVATVVQVAAVFQAGSGAVSALTMPWDPRFWSYVLGLVGGSLWLPGFSPDEADLLLTAVCAAIGIGLWGVAVVRSLLVVMRRRSASDIAPIVLLVISAVVIAYVGIVAGGRAMVDSGGQPIPGQTVLAAFTSGRLAHHPYWITAVWAWVAAVLVDGLRSRLRDRRLHGWLRAAAVAVVIMLVAGSATRGSFDFPTYYDSTARLRATVLECLVDGLDRGVPPLHCDNTPAFDLTDAVRRAMARGASFTHYLEFTPARESLPPFYRMSTATTPIEVTGAGTVQRTTDGYHLAGLSGARTKLTASDPDALGRCMVLEVRARLRSPSGATAYVLWADPASPYGGIASLPKTVGGDSWATVDFYVRNPTGFGPWVWLLFSPDPQSVDLGEVEFWCRLTTA